ncbi:Mus7/MMS22 family [Teratosphaeria destructans]|uniref:Mus7/MMS22 family n=1 Tax=Teratosphaeria destructans TaxID=418781 RepID=A0A9W7SKZ3_9PEZI|nr:Mus7/MMS22 family [Teratosphaeria destructans]
MKRWQDRGEVLDSDEEDLELSNDSQSPEQPRKRQRLDDSAVGSRQSAHAESPCRSNGVTDCNEIGARLDGGDHNLPAAILETARTGTDGHASQRSLDQLIDADDNGAEESWMQPKAITRYGRRARNSRPPSRHGDAPTSARNVTSLDGAADPVPSQTNHLKDGAQDENDRASSGPAADVNDHLEGTGAVKDVAYADPHVEQSAPTVETLFAPSSPTSSEDESLPDLNHLFRRTDRRPQTPDAEPQYNSSALSSAPNSPELPAQLSQFSLPRVVTGVELPPALNTSADVEIRSDSSAAQGVQGLQSADCTNGQGTANPGVQADATHGRRSLRTRTEKQLHPYIYDRTIYQQQWKQRGLKPVHFVMEERPAHKPKDHSYDTDGSRTQEQQPQNSSPSRPISDLNGDSGSESGPSTTHHRTGSDDELRDLDAVSDRRLSRAVQDGHKRRKTSHSSRPGQLKSIRYQEPLKSPPSQRDRSPVPISPPPTSSDSTRQQVGVTLPSGFRLPFGVTPAPLPTPQISSETKPSCANAGSSDSDVPVSRSRRTTLDRAPSHAIPIDSSAESDSSTDSPPEELPEIVDDRRLQRERRRIRGVLPASWLRIDLRAQQKPSASPMRARHSSVSPPPTDRPSKGIAQRVFRNSDTPSRGNLIDIGDSGDDEPASPPRLPYQPRQRRLYLNRDYHSTARNTEIDDEPMEMDWVDPMVAGTSRHRRSEPTRRQRQPKIKDAFRRARESSNDFSEERAGLRFARASATRPQQAKQPRDARPARRKRCNGSSGLPLSIIDAPISPKAQSTAPQFVRLAQRQARRQTSLGRHSPSHKVIRLATNTETKEALELLSAWRQGTIMPRSTPELVSQHQGCKQIMPSSSPGRIADDQSDSRLPLLDVTDQRTNQTNSVVPKRAEGSIAKDKFHSKEAYMGKPGLVPAGLDSMLVPWPSAAAGSTAAGRLKLRGNDRRGDQSKPTARFRVLPQDGRARGAQLEALENAFDTEHRSAAFERRMNVLTEGIARPLHVSRTQALPLDRFLDISPSDPYPVAVRKTAPLSTGPSNERVSAVSNNETARQQLMAVRQTKLIHRPRKYPPRRINVESREYRQPSEPLPEPNTVEDEPVSTNSDGSNVAVLQGLGPFGTRYAISFDIQALEPGTHFQHSTFIGSGDLDAALQLGNRNLDTAVCGQMRVHVDDEVCEWGPWTEEVADGLAKIPPVVTKGLELMRQFTHDNTSCHDQLASVTANIDHMLRSVIRYCSKVLVFLDPIDRRLCVQLLQSRIEDLLDVLDGPLPSQSDLLQVNTRCHEYILVLASQACILAQHHLVPVDALKKSQELKNIAAMRLSARLMRFVFDDLAAFYDDNRHSWKRECGVGDEWRSVAGVVILHHCLRLDGNLAFWQVIKSTSNAQTRSLSSVQGLDREWHHLYALLPVLEIDATGKTSPGSRFNSTQQDWQIVKSLLDRLLEFYPATSLVRGTTVNAYMRATLTRCYNLISHWGWRECEIMLGTIFDFFARRMLAPLAKEEAHGSPQFLADLENRPSLQVQPEDRSFSIFLKTLALGLLNMQKYSIYSDKRIGSIAWRFVPNHSRSYQKEKSVDRSDLDALRNHHDLLCTLYFACPAGYRIRLDSVRNIVDHNTWHREACRISVRAWTNLTSFQASIGEPAESLQPFLDWYRDIIAATVSQYRLAKTEAEADFARAKATGAVGITDALLDSTIATNQRNIAATLVDALAGLKRALRAAKTLPLALQLLEGSYFWTPFVPFDAGERRLFGALREALEVAKAAIQVRDQLSAPFESQHSSEESQDYGDLDALEELAGTEMVCRPVRNDVFEILHEPLAQLMSNVFGADQTIDEHLLSDLIDVWVQLAAESVRSGLRSWSSYVEQYSAHSWHQLRDTDQKRKFTSCFFARLVEKAGRSLDDVTPHVFESWLVCLVEREAMLKHQHRFTSSLLDTAAEHPLLVNLPFVTDGRTSLHNISLHELRQRRLTLISSLLSNMRTHIDNLTYQRSKRQEVEQMYSGMVRSMMQAMKCNYQELQSPGNQAGTDGNLQGAYVDFVQQVVTFLHASSIVKVDSFFTDSSVFPLPAGDPTYVVGRLKAYIPKLANLGAQKALAIAIQSISERAAVDGQQTYLVEQLLSAMDEGAELGSQDRPTLRRVLLTAILPAYVAQALSTASSWILAVPMLETYESVVGGLQYVVRVEDDSSLNAVIGILHMTVIALLEPLHFALERVGRLILPHVENVLALVFGVGRSMLKLCGHLKRSQGLGRPLIEALANMRVLALEIRSHLSNDDERWFTGLPHNVPAPSSDPWVETRHYAQAALAKSFETEWLARDGRYVLTKHNVPKEVVVRLRTDGAAQQALLQNIARFLDDFEIVVDGRRRNRRGAAGNAGSSILDGVMI